MFCFGGGWEHKAFRGMLPRDFSAPVFGDMKKSLVFMSMFSSH